MSDTQPQPGAATGPTLHTCPDCGGILEPTNPPWQALVQSFHAAPSHAPRAGADRWQCLICGYRKP